MAEPNDHEPVPEGTTRSVSNQSAHDQASKITCSEDGTLLTIDGSLFFRFASLNPKLWRLVEGATIHHELLGEGNLLDVDSDLTWLTISFINTGTRYFKRKSPHLEGISQLQLRLLLSDPDSLSRRSTLLSIEEMDPVTEAQNWANELKRAETERIAEQEQQRKATERAVAEREAEYKQQLERTKQAQAIRRADDERQRKEALIQEARRRESLRILRLQFQSEYQGARDLFDRKLSVNLTDSEFQDEARAFVRSWVIAHGFGGKAPDDEQATAIGAMDRQILLTARAGSGKTTTLVNRALFLIGACKVLPQQIMLLAFNRAAAQEIRERLEKTLPGSTPHVMTFHALAYALVHPEKTLVFDDPEGSSQKTQCMQLVIDDFKRNPLYRERIKSLMLAHFRGEWERDARGGWDRPPEEALHHRRTSVAWESINGKPIKSFGEKLIADFLFEHDVPYWYEPNRKWGGINYRPDFMVPTGKGEGIVIEYFGLAGDPEYDEMTQKKRDYWKSQDGYRLLEFYPGDISREGPVVFLKHLKGTLEEAGVPCRRLSEEEIWIRIKKRALNRFDKIMTSLVGRFRKLSLNPFQALDFVKSERLKRVFDPMEVEFLELGICFFEGYLERLDATGEEDFDGLMVEAANHIRTGKTRFQRKSGEGDLVALRHLLIDEYQDFSQLFHGLVEGMQVHVPDLKIFCVGDDWQAINGFAGSDLKFFQSFESYFPGATRLSLRTNYRSGTSIVEFGNEVMRGRGHSSVAHRTDRGELWLADLAYFNPTEGEQERFPGVTVLPAAIRLAYAATQDGKKVVFLNRTNGIAQFMGRVEGEDDGYDPRALMGFLEAVREMLPEQQRKWVSISTSHKYKGKEEEVVVILDVLDRRYPLIHPDHQFFRVFGDSEEALVEDERRLFYVAVTRAKDKLILLSEKDRFSPFLLELPTLKSQSKALPNINWASLMPPVRSTDHGRLLVQVMDVPSRPAGVSGEWGTYSIKKYLKAEGYTWNPSTRRSGSDGERGKEGNWSRATTREHLDIQTLRQSLWSMEGQGLCVRICSMDEAPVAEFSVDRGQWIRHFDTLGLEGGSLAEGATSCPF